jgi:hypothetical protein
MISSILGLEPMMKELDEKPQWSVLGPVVSGWRWPNVSWLRG